MAAVSDHFISLCLLPFFCGISSFLLFFFIFFIAQGSFYSHGSYFVLLEGRRPQFKGSRGEAFGRERGWN